MIIIGSSLIGGYLLGMYYLLMESHIAIAASPNLSFNGSFVALDKFLLIDWIGAIIFLVVGILELLALNWGSTVDWKSH